MTQVVGREVHQLQVLRKEVDITFRWKPTRIFFAQRILRNGTGKSKTATPAAAIHPVNCLLRRLGKRSANRFSAPFTLPFFRPRNCIHSELVRGDRIALCWTNLRYTQKTGRGEGDLGGRQSSDKNYSNSQYSDKTYTSQFSDKNLGTLQFSDNIEKEPVPMPMRYIMYCTW